MRLLPLTALWLLSCVTLCACGPADRATVPELRIVGPTVPPHLLTCADEPADPSGKPDLTQRDVARYIVLVRAAGEDCRAKLGEVRGLVEKARSHAAGR